MGLYELLRSSQGHVWLSFAVITNEQVKVRESDQVPLVYSSKHQALKKPSCGGGLERKCCFCS